MSKELVRKIDIIETRRLIRKRGIKRTELAREQGWVYRTFNEVITWQVRPARNGGAMQEIYDYLDRAGLLVFENDDAV